MNHSSVSKGYPDPVFQPTSCSENSFHYLLSIQNARWCGKQSCTNCTFKNLSRCVAVVFFTHVTHPRLVVARIICVRTRPLMFVAATLSIFNKPAINVAMATTSVLLRDESAVLNLREVVWWVLVMPVVETPRITRMTSLRFACVERCTTPFPHESVVAAKLWRLLRFAAAMKRTEPPTIWKLARLAVELNTFLKTRAFVVKDQREMSW